MNRALAGLAALVLLVGCRESPRGGMPVSGPSFDISESRTGGNPDLFFSQPLAATPQPGDAGFDVGAAHAVLVPYVRICETDGAESPAGCVIDVTALATGSATGLAMTFNATAEVYQVNWQTKALDVAKNYRIEVWGIAFSTAAEKAELDARWLFGWRDISNSPEVSACHGFEEFCLINYGQNLPIKVRIEQFVFCPVTRDCAVQFVASGVDANLEATLPSGAASTTAQLFIPGQTGTDFAIAFEPCTAAQNAALEDAIDLPTFGPCVHTITDFSEALTTPALISLCTEFGGVDPSGFGLSPEQEEQLTLHHVTEDFSRVDALPDAWQCGDPTSGGVASARSPTGRLLQLARTAGRNTLAWLTPRPLSASAALIDRGGGGESIFLESFFKLALPARFERGSPVFQVQLAGSDVTLTARATDLFGVGVQNARVHWTFQPPPASDVSDGCVLVGGAGSSCASGEVIAYTDATGLAQATVRLSPSSGDNVFHAGGRGIADDRETGCTVQRPAPGTDSRCNGPRTDAPYGPYDPFMPLNHGDAVDGNPPTSPPVEVAEGTRLPFTVFGCVPGQGTATVNGSLGSDEWQCANTYDFTANVSGGSTPATLYVMNDATNLYLAVRLQRSGSDRVNTLQFNFDNNGSWTPLTGLGAAEEGDDVLSFDAVKGFTDAFLTLKCANSSQSSCWATDVSGGGTTDGSGAVTNDGTFTTYEISHPLNTTDDAHDYSLSGGSKVGLFLTMQTGSGAAGNTQWPQFRKYLEIVVQP